MCWYPQIVECGKIDKPSSICIFHSFAVTFHDISYRGVSNMCIEITCYYHIIIHVYIINSFLQDPLTVYKNSIPCLLLIILIFCNEGFQGLTHIYFSQQSVYQHVFDLVRFMCNLDVQEKFISERPCTNQDAKKFRKC